VKTSFTDFWALHESKPSHQHFAGGILGFCKYQGKMGLAQPRRTAVREMQLAKYWF
jgi:hypothetical protein